LCHGLELIPEAGGFRLRFNDGMETLEIRSDALAALTLNHVHDNPDLAHAALWHWAGQARIQAMMNRPARQIRFDGPPGPQSGRFVESEDADGKGINAGDWEEQPDGTWLLKLRPHRQCECPPFEVMQEVGLDRWSCTGCGRSWMIPPTGVRWASQYLEDFAQAKGLSGPQLKQATDTLAAIAVDKQAELTDAHNQRAGLRREGSR
jgi:hypothetical protein